MTYEEGLSGLAPAELQALLTAAVAVSPPPAGTCRVATAVSPPPAGTCRVATVAVVPPPLGTCRVAAVAR
jgi:hypothetical protein